MILLDANIFMYAAGAEHKNKAPSVALLERVVTGKVEVCTDAEVLQEILHRYRAINRWSDGQRVYDLTRTICRNILPITVEIMDHARLLLDTYSPLSARDAVHASVCLSVGAKAICSYDADFDRVKELRRVEPSKVK